MTSGCRRRISRIFLAAASPSCRESVIGMEARIQKLPSSRWGRNSLPSRGAISKKVPSIMATSITTTRDAMAKRKTQRRIVEPVQYPNEDRLRLLHALRKQYGGQRRRNRERGNQSSRQRITVGARHRAEDLALDALHGEEWHEARHRDQRGEEDRLVHLHRADQNQPHAIRPPLRFRRILLRSCRVRPPEACGEPFQQ